MKLSGQKEFFDLPGVGFSIKQLDDESRREGTRNSHTHRTNNESDQKAQQALELVVQARGTRFNEERQLEAITFDFGKVDMPCPAVIASTWFERNFSSDTSIQRFKMGAREDKG